jgi:hypothetical protein
MIWALVCLLVALGLAVGTVCFWRAGKGDSHRFTGNDMTGWAVAFAIATVAVFTVSSVLWFNGLDGVKSTGVRLETQLNSQWLNDENVLSTYMNGFSEMIGTANLESDKVQKIIVDSVGSQVDLNAWSANPTASPLYSALVQAYPKVSLEQYQQVIDYIRQGRASFQAQQQKLLTLLSQYDSWREQGLLIHTSEVGFFGFPSNLLTVTVGGHTLHGAAAEEQMWNIVRNPAVEAAFISGVDTPVSAHP